MDKEPRKLRVKSPYLFPSYSFGTAVALASILLRDGGGSLSETTLAMALGISSKSSGFRLKVLAARQFGLLVKQGGNLSTTPLAKAVTQPTNNAGEREARLASFLEVPLFKAIAARFRGQPLPPEQMLRRVLEQEFRLESNRVGEALRIFQDSAREAGLLRSSGEKVFLDTETSMRGPPNYLAGFEPAAQTQMAFTPGTSVPTGNLLTISEEDLAGLNDAEYAEIWQALGKVIRNRSKRTTAPDGAGDTE